MENHVADRSEIPIRSATTGDLTALSSIAARAKAHWGYPEEWLAEWRPQLTVTAADLAEQEIFVACGEENPVGFYGLLFGEVASLEHLWVDPGAMGRGVGRALLEHAVRRVRRRGHASLQIDSDPHAEAFYLHMGATRVGWVPAPVAGTARRLPRLALDVRRSALP